MDFSHAQPQANPHYTGPHFSEHVWAQLNARALREGKHPYGIVEEIVSEYFAVPGSTL
ncbi:hypothetical protein Clow_00097 [Corynebacterium lowii]|uniref:Uncharacterized protein n=2 Tax=Corynebacterium lowii TaxID=1544413 RepID=A0A0Q0U537_9CORY|nr:hypothetical protein Clow_00097 [Corynebacterium lowii]